MVPADQVDKLRLELAPTLTSGSKGYELMDSGSSFGMTDEEFKIKKVRMQQGELEKTIKSFPQVEECKSTYYRGYKLLFLQKIEHQESSCFFKVKKGDNT